MRTPDFAIRPASIAFSSWILLFGLILFDGYVLHFLGLPSDSAAILGLILVQAAIIAWWFAGHVTLAEADPLELAGFLLVAVVVWLYFVYPSWPTLLPPTHSGDGANHAREASLVFARGDLFSDYPAGPALLTATLSHWIGWSTLRMLHLTAALWASLTAAGIYALACAILPDRSGNKVLALLAPFALFIPWAYFGGLLIDISYFSPQVLGQLFVIAFILFLVESTQSANPLWSIGMGLCLIGISVSFQLWLVVPVLVLAWTVFEAWLSRGGNSPAIYRSFAVTVGSTALFWLALLLASRDLIPNPDRLKIADAAVISPSFQQLGGLYLLLPALGFLILLRRGGRTRIVTAFALLTGLQTLALVGANAWFGFSLYWMSKSFFLAALALPLCTVVLVARLVELAPLRLARRVLSSAVALPVVAFILCTLTVWANPPSPFSVLAESDIQAALWAREHLDTLHVNFLSRKSLAASWLGRGIWDESYPNDLFVDLAALGPKVFEDWRNDADWGEYLFVTSNQHMSPDPSLGLVYADGSSQILSKPANGPIDISSQTPLGRFGNIFELLSSSHPNPAIRAGEVLSLTLQVKPIALPSNHVEWRLLLRDQANNPVADSSTEPFSGKFPLQRWPDGRVMSQSLQVTVPAGAAAGLTSLKLGLVTNDGELLPFESAGKGALDLVTLDAIKIPLPATSMEALASLERPEVVFGDSIQLYGYRLDDTALHPGGSVHITFYWLCLAPVSQDYTFFLHLVDPSGQVRAQRDTAPRAGSYPTSIWDKGEIVPDEYMLVVPADAPGGVYRLDAGFYEWPSMRHLQTTSGASGPSNQFTLPDKLYVSSGE